MPLVGVNPGSAIARHRRMFQALEAAFDVRFESSDRAGDKTYDAVVRIGTTAGAVLPERVSARTPALAYADQPAFAERAVPVRLHDSEPVDRRLRGAVLRVEPAGPPLTTADDESVLASSETGPMWIQRSHERAFRVRAALPTLADDEVLADVLRSGRALALIALVSLLRSLRPSAEPALRAAFVFDDPNLRRRSYGFIDYRRLVDHADAHGYHVAMALIPQDAHRWDPRTVALFKQRSDRLSLVVHGNDHSSHELSRARDFAGALSLGAQAIRRVRSFEQRAGLGVDRVMMPPHGLCSRTVTRALGALGYDALCAKHPCPWSERPPRERVLAGWTPAELVDGCAVVPRFHLSSPPSEILLRAFLGQPLILYGHHRDLAGGFELLGELAGRINQLGDVRWCPVREIVHNNYELDRRGDSLVVRPWANRLRLDLPDEVTRVTVEPPPGEAAREGLGGWSTGPSAPALAFGVPQPLGGARQLTIHLRSRWEVDPVGVADPRWRAWPRLRRRLTEARDRTAPLRLRPWTRGAM